MKKLLLSLVMVFVTGVICFGQDIIVFKNGNETKVKIIEVTSDEVKFKKIDNIDGPLYTVLKSDLYNITYENGGKDVFTEMPAPVTPPPPGPIIIVKEKKPAKAHPDRISYSGPRVGATFIGNGSTKDLLAEKGYNFPMVSQFGYQFETVIFGLDNGTTGLLNWVLLIGGLEKSLVVPSGSMIIGMRTSKGIEFGLGPNVSGYTGETGGFRLGLGLAFAVGTSIRTKNVNFPINLAFIPSVKRNNEPTGFRISLHAGFNIQKKKS